MLELHRVDTGSSCGQRCYVPVQDLDAEAAYLSWLLLGGEPIHGLEPEAFFSESNRRVYEVIVALYEEGEPIDTVLIAGRLRDSDRLRQIGGSTYLAQLCDAVPSIAHPEAYVERIYDRYMIRKIVAALQEWTIEAKTGTVDWNTMMLRVREGIGNL